MKKLALCALCAAAIAFPALAQAPKAQEKKEIFPSPNEIVDKAEVTDWVRIKPEDLLVMDLAADHDGKPRRVIIQLMPPPFSQGWIGNMRKLAQAHWWDGTSVNRVQDNYVVQWGDASEKKKLPEGLAVMVEEEYETAGDLISEALSARRAKAAELRHKAEHSPELVAAQKILNDPKSAEADHEIALDILMEVSGLNGMKTPGEVPVDMKSTKSEKFPEGWHERDSFTEWVELIDGWPTGNKGEGDDAVFWPVHCYGMVGVGRGYSPDTGTGAELYTVIGHAPRHLDRNIALVGRIIEGMEHLSSLPRGTGPLGFYETPGERTAIQSVRLMSDMVEGTALPEYEYLSTESAAFAKYADARANRRDPFFIKPAGGADICNIPVPVRRVKAE